MLYLKTKKGLHNVQCLSPDDEVYLKGIDFDDLIKLVKSSIKFIVNNGQSVGDKPTDCYVYFGRVEILHGRYSFGPEHNRCHGVYVTTYTHDYIIQERFSWYEIEGCRRHDYSETLSVQENFKDYPFEG